MTEIATKSEAAIEKHLIEMNDVVTEYLKGNTRPVTIAKKLGMSTQKASSLLKEWRGLAQNNQALKDRAALVVRGADEHYSQLIASAYESLAIAEESDSNNQRMAAIKLIMDIEKTRFTMLQQAGALEDSDLSRQLIETERKQEILTKILKETVGPCKRCRPIVQEKLAAMTNEVVVIRADPK